VTQFRELQPGDSLVIDGIYEKFHRDGFGIPSRTHLVTEGVAENESGVIAYGMVKLFCEAIMVLDLDQPDREKISAIRELMSVAIMDSTKLGAEQLHVFVQNPNFAEVLKKHFGFMPCKGEALVLNL
jgi:hypothetical protein